MIGYIHSIETMALVDGPGIRCVVFMQGCRLRCKYCHNPDTWKIAGDQTNQCDDTVKACDLSKTDKANATCGLDQIEEYTPYELVNKLVRYKDYFARDGGVTFSGGEPLLQPEFLKEALTFCKDNGIHTCIDTSGFGICDYDYGEILELTDLVLFDIKQIDPKEYCDLTGQDIGLSDSFLRACIEKNVSLWLSHVMVPGLTDNDEFINKFKDYILKIPNVKNIRILPYHTLGSNKYKELGIKEPLAGTLPMDRERAAAYEKYLKSQYYKEKENGD